MITALHAAAAKRAPDPVDTLALLVELMRADSSGDWSRIQLYAGDIDAIENKLVLDPARTGEGRWENVPLTDTCAIALDVAGRLARRYSLWPIPVGLVVIGLIADAAAAAATALREDLDRNDLLAMVQSEVLGVTLGGLDNSLTVILAEAQHAHRTPHAPPPSRPRVPASPKETAPQYFPANNSPCGVCGSIPATPATFHAHLGLLLYMRIRTERGMYCRDCGVATFRRMTGETLWQGWWGLLSLLIAPLLLLGNLGVGHRVRQLPPPIPGSPRQPLPPGKPLYRRPQFLGMAVPVALIGLFLYANLSAETNNQPAKASSTTSATTTPAKYPPTTSTRNPFDAQPGECVWNKRGPIDVNSYDPDIEVIPCTDPRAQATVLGTTLKLFGISCQDRYPQTDVVYSSTTTIGSNTLGTQLLCLKTRR